MFKNDYLTALEDYKKARRSASIQELLARLSGSPENAALFSYDDVRQRLRAIQKGSEHLADIPLDAIVGSVGRYDDFTRKFTPKKSIYQSRWARVNALSQGLSVLPAIEVYSIGDVYFVKDGNHRVSVARQMGNSSIQAYVTVVNTKVSLPIDITPDELIIKGEQVKFLEQTKLDQSIPGVDLSATTPGAYPSLLEHIAVHRYFMGIEQEREILFSEASEHWYRSVFQPVLDIIRQRDLLCDFPDRTVTDMYLWAADHRASLTDLVGWDIGTEAALNDLTDRHSSLKKLSLKKTVRRLFNFVKPDIIEPGPPPGTWRERLSRMTVLESLFNDLIVAVDDSQNAWNALDMAIQIAQTESSRIHGVHIHPQLDGPSHQDHEHLKLIFNENCQEVGVPEYDFIVTKGEIWEILSEQSRFADLVVLPLNYPPGTKPSQRLSSGITTLLRSCPIPVLTIPNKPRQINTIILAYDGSLKAREAMFIAAYLGTQQGISLIVLTSTIGVSNSAEIQAEAKDYLNDFPLKAHYLITEANVSLAISHIMDQELVDLIIMGGYGGSSLLPVMLGSVVDQVLREIHLPILICR